MASPRIQIQPAPGSYTLWSVPLQSQLLGFLPYSRHAGLLYFLLAWKALLRAWHSGAAQKLLLSVTVWRNQAHVSHVSRTGPGTCLRSACPLCTPQPSAERCREVTCSPLSPRAWLPCPGRPRGLLAKSSHNPGQGVLSPLCRGPTTSHRRPGEQEGRIQTQQAPSRT